MRRFLTAAPRPRGMVTALSAVCGSGRLATALPARGWRMLSGAAGGGREPPVAPLSSAAPASTASGGGSNGSKREESTWDIIKTVLAAGKEERERKKREEAEKRGEPAVGKLDPESLERLLQLARPEAPRLLAAVATLGVTSAISLYFPFAMGKITDAALVVNDAAGGGWTPAAISAGLLGLFAVQSALIGVRGALLTVAGERLSANLRKDTFRALLSQEIAWHDSQKVGDVVNRLSSDTKVLQSALTSNIASGLRSAAMAVGSAGMLFYLSPSLAATSLALIPPVALAGMTYGRYVAGQQKRVQQALGATIGVAEEALGAVRAVRQLAAERLMAARFGSAVEDSYGQARRIGLVAAWFDGAVHFAANIGLVAVLWVGGQQVAEGTLSAGELTSFLVYSIYTGINVASLSNTYTELKRASGAAGRLFEILDRAPAMPLTTVPQQAFWAAGEGGSLPAETMLAGEAAAAAAAGGGAASSSSSSAGGAVLPSVRGELQLRGVTFAYPSRPQQPVLQGLDLTLPAGKSVALVGSSGSGKSTVAALLTRLYDAQAGAVLLDGRDVTSLDPTWLRQQVAVVPQEPVLFNLTIADNIALGRPGASRAQVEEAARAARAHDFIAAFPQGYDTPVGERGMQLSGGQRQRVAIARALLRGSRILILDEATSALDSESEAGVHEALAAVASRGDVTVLSIAHRLSTMRAAESIAVVAGGRIVEQGPYAELVARPDGAFRTLVEKQLTA